jgi:hypothetical protein
VCVPDEPKTVVVLELLWLEVRVVPETVLDTPVVWVGIVVAVPEVLPEALEVLVELGGTHLPSLESQT